VGCACRVGDAAAAAAYVEYEFTAAPVVGPRVQSTYTLVGDLGQTEHSLSTLQHMQGSGGRLVVHVGDLSYADGFQPRWDTYGRLVEPRACRCLPAASHPSPRTHTAALSECSPLRTSESTPIRLLRRFSERLAHQR
jgi:hypothetical protein